MSSGHSLEDYKQYTRKLKAKAQLLHEKNEDLVLKLTDLRSKDKRENKDQMIKFTIKLNNTIIKVQVGPES
jgi:hypothetical protein